MIVCLYKWKKNFFVSSTDNTSLINKNFNKIDLGIVLGL